MKLKDVTKWIYKRYETHEKVLEHVEVSIHNVAHQELWMEFSPPDPWPYVINDMRDAYLNLQNS